MFRVSVEFPDGTSYSLKQSALAAAPPEKKKKTKACWACGKAGVETKKCSGCEVARYCSRECSKRDWKEHRKTCGKEV